MHTDVKVYHKITDFMWIFTTKSFGNRILHVIYNVMYMDVYSDNVTCDMDHFKIKGETKLESVAYY